MGTMNDNSPETKTLPEKRIPRSEKVSLKLTPDEKRALDKMAWDKDDSVSRLIRRALVNTYPDEFAGKN